jgi:DNA-binding NtrC family response regulator
MSNLKILLIDDEEDFRKILGARITRWGYELLEAGSGQEGIDVLTRDKPDIIILDYIMPGMDGVATLREIRKLDDKIPVIIFTAHLHEKTIFEAEHLGVSAFVPKISAYTDTIAALETAIKIAETQLH